MQQIKVMIAMVLGFIEGLIEWVFELMEG